MSTVQKILSPEEIATQSPVHVPHLRLPDRRYVFAARAERLRSLAGGHAMADFLLFMAKVADQQQKMLDNISGVMLPKTELLAQCREHGMPPLNPQTLPREQVWCDLLRRLLRDLAEQTEGPLKARIQKLEGERDALYEAQASKLLAGIMFGLDLGDAPLIAAALQVYWTHLATTLGVDEFPPIDVPNLCPCCGQRPVASITRIGAQESGFRFLHCSLCAAEWHMVRIKCVACDSTKGIHYQSIDDGRPGTQHAVKAECCDECDSYLKIVYQDRDPHVDPVADDLASLALDLMVNDTLGKTGFGVNLMLLHGPGTDDRDGGGG